jgi:hypothetical protein
MFGEAQRAAVLDASVYREVAADEGGLMEALQVVLFVGVASGVGSMIGAMLLRNPSPVAVTAFMVDFVGTLVGWVIWAFATYVVGRFLFGGQATFAGLLRAEGYALAPYAIAFWGLVPIVGMLFRLLASLWIIVTGIVAIREAFGFSTGLAVATAILSIVLLCLLTVPLVLALVAMGIASGVFGSLVPGPR